MSRFPDEADSDEYHVHVDLSTRLPSIASNDLNDEDSLDESAFRSARIITTTSISEVTRTETITSATQVVLNTFVDTISYVETITEGSRPADSTVKRIAATPTASILSDSISTSPTTREERAKEESEWQANTKTWVASMVSVLVVIIIMVFLRMYLRRRVQKGAKEQRGELPSMRRRRTSERSCRRSSGYDAAIARYQGEMGGMPLDCFPPRTRTQADVAVAEYERDLELGRLQYVPGADLSRIPPDDAELPTYTEAAQVGERIMGGPNRLRPPSALMDPIPIPIEPLPTYNAVVRS